MEEGLHLMMARFFHGSRSGLAANQLEVMLDDASGGFIFHDTAADNPRNHQSVA